MDLLFTSSSSTLGRMGFLVITFPLETLPHTHTGNSGGQVQGFSFLRNAFFTIRSSREWKVIMQNMLKELEAQGIQVKGAEMTMIANTPSAVSVADAKKVMRLIDKLEELEDLQAVYHTMDITDEIAEALDE